MIRNTEGDTYADRSIEMDSKNTLRLRIIAERTFNKIYDKGMYSLIHYSLSIPLTTQKPNCP